MSRSWLARPVHELGRVQVLGVVVVVHADLHSAQVVVGLLLAHIDVTAIKQPDRTRHVVAERAACVLREAAAARRREHCDRVADQRGETQDGRDVELVVFHPFRVGVGEEAGRLLLLG